MNIAQNAFEAHAAQVSVLNGQTEEGIDGVDDIVAEIRFEIRRSFRRG